MTEPTGLAPPPPPKPYLGRAVRDGIVRFLALTTLEKADPMSGGCLRKYHYRYVGMREEPKKDSQQLGTLTHAEFSRYYITGERVLGPLASTAWHIMPALGSDLLIEHPITPIAVPHPKYADKPSLKPEEQSDEERAARAANAAAVDAGLAAAPLRAAGVPLIGDIDLGHRRGTNRGTENIEDAIDPPGTIEILDWKTTGDARWMKSAADLPHTIQMAGYGEWAYRVTGHDGFVRLSHGYIFTKKTRPAHKVTTRVTRETIAPAWARAERVATNILAAVKIQDPDQIPANLSACSAFGGCPHKSYCKAGMTSSLDLFLGRTAAENIKLLPIFPDDNAKPQETTKMSIMDMLPKNPATAAATPAAPTPDPQAVAQAAAEAARAAALAALPPGFPEALAAIKASGLGKPMMRGAATDGIITVTGIKATPGAALAGAGILAALTLDTPPQVVELADILANPARATDRAQLVDSLTPKTVVATPDVTVTANAVQPSVTMTLTPPDAPQSHPALAMSGRADGEPEVEANPEAPADGATVPPGSLGQVTAPRPRKKRTDPAGTDGNVGGAAQNTGGPTVAQQVTQGITLYVDCMPRDGAVDLTPFVRRCAQILAEAKPDPKTKQALADIRFTPSDEHAYAFGRWKPALQALAVESIGQIAPGAYYLDTRADELSAAVAVALKTVTAGYVLATAGLRQ